MLSQLKWQPLVERRRHARLVMFIIYKIHYQLVSPYTLTSKFYLQPTLRIFCLSSSCDYHLQSFFPRTVRDWNTLPQEVVRLGLPTCPSYCLKTAGVLPALCCVLICTLLFACTVSCQHLVEWRSGHPLHCVCVPPTMY